MLTAANVDMVGSSSRASLSSCSLQTSQAGYRYSCPTKSQTSFTWHDACICPFIVSTKTEIAQQSVLCLIMTYGVTITTHGFWQLHRTQGMTLSE